MMIREYTDHAHLFSTFNTQDKIAAKIAKTALDTCLVTAYIVSLLSIIPLLITYAWAKDVLSVQRSAQS